MSRIALEPNASGSGVFTIASPNSNTSRTLNLPDAAGTLDTVQRAGNVLQVVSAVKTDTFTTASTSYVDVTGLSVSITPSSATNKILIFYKVNYGNTGTSATGMRMQLVRGSTAIFIGDSAASRILATSAGSTANLTDFMADWNGMFLDSPTTTSNTTYKIQFSTRANTGVINRNGDDSDSPANARGVSSITVMEIAA
jgi:hypothetical protein